METRTMFQSEYAKAGVDYSKIEPFKMAMKAVGQTTLVFPKKRRVLVTADDHCCRFRFCGEEPHVWGQTTEGLGNKNWIAEWMRQLVGTGKTYYDGIGYDAAMMAVNDLAAGGFLPVVYTDEVAAGDSEWFTDQQRSSDLANSYFRACKDSGMALPAGESPSLRYLVKAEQPVKSAPSLSGCATGIMLNPSEVENRWNTGIRAGDSIIGVGSSGIHANGISLVIRKALELPGRFLTELPNGKTLGDEALIETLCYVKLVEELLAAGVEIHCVLPGTGGGVSKVAFDKRNFTYRIFAWPEVPLLLKFLREIGVSLMDCLTTFNWGVGYYLFVPSHVVDRVLQLGRLAGYNMMFVGRVEDGERKVIFGPENDLVLPPPGE